MLLFMIIRTLMIFVALGAIVVNAAGQNLILGVLEDVPGVYVGESDVRRVRTTFQKNGQNWTAFPSECSDPHCLKTISSQFPREVNWTVGFDGRILGQITGRTPNEFKFYAHVGLQDITSATLIPTVGKKSSDYGDFTGASVYRPLVTNSQPFFNDPESWKPSQPSPELVRLLRQEFRRKFPKLCKMSEQDESKLVPFSYDDSDVKLVKGYASNKGWTLARLHLQDAIDCKDIEAGLEIDDPWFALDPHRAVQYLDSGMWLVDAGDYDNDGRSEVVFSIVGENRGGYELYYDDLKKHVTFEFGFH